MKNKFLVTVVIFFFILAISLVFATNFTATVAPTIADSGLSNKLLNFTLTNTGPANITVVNITLPSGFSFVLNSNGTNATDALFVNISLSKISWINTSASGIVNATAHFWFNVSIPKNIYGAYNFNISTNDTSVNFNSTNVSLNIERATWSSSLGQFYVKPVEIYLNWTNNYTANISITLNETLNNITILLDNSTAVSGNYSQPYGSGDSDYCKTLYTLHVKNASNDFTNLVTLNASDSVNITIADNLGFYNHRSCRPGRHWINQFIIRNWTRTNETANITIFIDIPISSYNNQNIFSTGVGTFAGALPGNATTYHSYYFNSSLVPNSTGIFINLTWSPSSDVDLFLFDSNGNLRAKSINYTFTNESLLLNHPPVNETWEIRFYGNSSSQITYSGVLIFTTLNSSSMKFELPVMNVSTTNNTNFTLRNEGSLNISNVSEVKELYIVKRFGGNSEKNFTFLIPNSSIIQKVKVSLNWTGSSNYSFNLYNQNDTLLISSMNKFVIANMTKAMQEEYNETTNIPRTSGIWKVWVKNNTNITDQYNVTVYLYLNASKWVTTNYSSIRFYSFNTSFVQINFTVQNETIDGLYEGSIQYLDGNGAGIKMPISFNVTTPMLIVNNSFESITARVDENYGTNLTREIILILNNTGSYGLTLTLTNSSNNTLTCTSGSCNSSYFANFTYNSITSIGSHSSATLSVNITFNSSMPTGLYEGWIKVNTSSLAVPLRSHPYEDFTTTLRLNLTNLLDIQVLEINSHSGDYVVYDNSTPLSENITVRFKVNYINGTEIEAQNQLNTSNFTIWLHENNMTSYRIPSIGSLSISNGSNPIYISSFYFRVNATIPSEKPGGVYGVYVTANYTKGSFSFGGTGVNKTLIFNNTGLHMSTNVTGCSFGSSCTPSISISNSSIYMVVVNVSNYGPITASGTYIKFNIPSACSGYSISARGITSGCGTFTVDNATITAPAHSTNCTVWWNISAGTSAASTCTSNIIGTPVNKWFNALGINISIIVTAPSGTTTTTSTTGGGTNVTLKYVAGLSFVKAESLIVLKQNSTNTTTVIVNNTGNKTQTVNFTIQNINSSWYFINATNVTLKKYESTAFKIIFSIGKAEINDYLGKFNATSSDKTISSDFTLRVNPTQKEGEAIVDTLALYKLNMTKLSDQIEDYKNNGMNVTEAEAKLSELITKIDEAQSYIDKSDYISAYKLYPDIENLISQVLDKLESVEKISEEKAKSTYRTWIMVGAGIVAGVVLIYLFWPTKAGYKPSKGKFVYKPSEKEITWEKLKEKWSKIGQQQFTPTYKPPPFKPKGEPILSKLKGTFSNLTKILKRKKE